MRLNRAANPEDARQIPVRSRLRPSASRNLRSCELRCKGTDCAPPVKVSAPSVGEARRRADEAAPLEVNIAALVFVGTDARDLAVLAPGRTSRLVRDRHAPDHRPMRAGRKLL
ncbi:hypothetical protein AURDEDRAFT_116795 [Auricularia subglabra TFB-10046 SS5]|nr:hypothetical protein AURDEDRAFT_116795 [Auricularia subglabra TFB-10046 SS5]